jgi:ankyrin repeat protein
VLVSVDLLFTLTQEAARQGREHAAKIRLSYKADPNIQSKHTGYTPLHFAAQRDYQSLAIVLVEHHADPNLPDKQGCTPLHECAKFGSLQTARALMIRGEVLLLVASSYCTVLPVWPGFCVPCLFYRCPVLTSSLLLLLLWCAPESGADAEQLDKHGFSCQFYAQKAGHTDVANLLPIVAEPDLLKLLKKEPNYESEVRAVKALAKKGKKGKGKGKDKAKGKKK